MVFSRGVRPRQTVNPRPRRSKRISIQPPVVISFVLAVYILAFAIPSLRNYAGSGTTSSSSFPTAATARSLLLHKDDYILFRDYDASPVVIEKFRLIFFTIPKVGCTVWKQLFRRIQGHPDWNDVNKAHDPNVNGLVYLSDYYNGVVNGTTPETGPQHVWHMLNSPEWTKAMFVRDPKERFLSAYLDKAVSNFGEHMETCCNQFLKQLEYNNTRRVAFGMKDGAIQSPFRDLDGCVKHTQANLDNFFDLISTTCPNDGHWLPQSQRIDAKYWEIFRKQSSKEKDNNRLFVGHMDTMEEDSKRLLKQIGAWDEYGASGWGVSGLLSIFGRETSAVMTHLTGAKKQLTWYYTPDNERRVDEFYAGDYSNDLLRLPKLPIKYIEEPNR